MYSCLSWRGWYSGVVVLLVVWALYRNLSTLTFTCLPSTSGVRLSSPSTLGTYPNDSWSYIRTGTRVGSLPHSFPPYLTRWERCLETLVSTSSGVLGVSVNSSIPLEGSLKSLSCGRTYLGCLNPHPHRRHLVPVPSGKNFRVLRDPPKS